MPSVLRCNGHSVKVLGLLLFSLIFVSAAHFILFILYSLFLRRQNYLTQPTMSVRYTLIVCRYDQ